MADESLVIDERPPTMPSPDSSPLSNRKVLVVEDTPEFREIVTGLLEKAGYETITAEDGLRAVELARKERPELIVLDIGLPKLDGIETCRRIRSFSDAYVLMLTARTTPADTVVGLSVGADDYMTKPFSPPELVARVGALLRRPRGFGEPPVKKPRIVGELEIDLDGRVVRFAGESVRLTRVQFDLLDALSTTPETVVTREQLLERVWGPNWFGDDHVVDVHISNLRQRIEPDPADPRYVKTVRGVGYRLDDGT